MVDINSTFQALAQPIAASIQTVTSTLQWLLSGVVGISVIIAIVNFYNNRKNRYELKEMKKELNSIHKTLIDIRELLQQKLQQKIKK